MNLETQIMVQEILISDDKAWLEDMKTEKARLGANASKWDIEELDAEIKKLENRIAVCTEVKATLEAQRGGE